MRISQAFPHFYAAYRATCKRVDLNAKNADIGEFSITELKLLAAADAEFECMSDDECVRIFDGDGTGGPDLGLSAAYLSADAVVVVIWGGGPGQPGDARFYGGL